MEQAKKAKLDPEAMEVDGKLLSLNSSVDDRVIMSELRQIVYRLEPYQNTTSMCADLNKIEFLQIRPSIDLKSMADIYSELTSIYEDAKFRLAETVSKTNHVELDVCQAAIEIRDVILKAELAPIGELEMKVYNTIVPDVQNIGSWTSIIIRPEDEAFWNRCIHISLSGKKVCGVGDPGIGKTTTTLYLLQQLIMNQKQAVVYTIRLPSYPTPEKDIFYEFVPVLDNDQVVDVMVKVYKLLSAEKKKIPSMNKKGAFYVVDPGLFKGSCDDTHERYLASFIMAASNDSVHWGGDDFTKYRKPNVERAHLQPRVPPKIGAKVYGSLWTGPQLIVARPYLDHLRAVSEEEIWYRFRIVGGSMCDIVGFIEKDFKQAVDSALNLEPHTVQELSDGTYRFEFDKKSPRSVLIGLGPDPQDSTLFKITLKSDFVEEHLANKYLKTSWYQVLNEENAGNRGNLFESYLRQKFSTAAVRFSQEEVRESLRTLPLPPPNKKRTNEKKNYRPVAGGMMLGANRSVVRVSNMFTSVRSDRSQQNMYYSKNESEPLIDMIFRVNNGYDAIQSTIATVHGGGTAAIRKLKTDLGLADNETLRIFFVVPWCHYSKFETTPINPLLDEQSLNNVFIYHVGVSSNES